MVTLCNQLGIPQDASLANLPGGSVRSQAKPGKLNEKLINLQQVKLRILHKSILTLNL